MFMLKPKKVAEDAPAGAPAWMTTFSDCMTLLLCFFVMLLSFSSFDKASLVQLFGALRCRPNPSIFDNTQLTDDTIAQQRDSVADDRTDKGAEKRSSESLEMVQNPRESEPVVETDAYHDERIFYIPTGRLFWGNGNALTGPGQEYMRKIAQFMKMVPCKVIVGQMNSSGSKPTGGADSADNGLTRSCAVIRFLTHRQGLPTDRFCVCPTRPSPSQKFRSESVIEIKLLAKDLTQ